MSRILILGAGGQLGWELVRTLHVLGEVIALDHAAVELTDPASIREAVRAVAPDIIMNAAAYTAVDRAESEPATAFAVNATAPEILAVEAKRLNALLVHYSTDYVFDGHATAPYVESDKTNPLSVYGASKLAGEQAIVSTDVAHLIFRTSWVFAARGGNFLRTMLRLARERQQLRVVSDQIGAPTWARTTAQVTASIFSELQADGKSDVLSAMAGRSGIYHLTAKGETNWFDYARAIFRLVPDDMRKLTDLVPIATRDYPTAATRPASSRLSTEKIERHWRVQLPGWQDALRLCSEELISNRISS